MTNGVAPSSIPDPDVGRAVAVARSIRWRAARMVAGHDVGYLGQALSSAELLGTLLTAFWRPGHDHFVLSPGHYVVAAYAAGVELGLLPAAELETYGHDGSRLEAIGTESSPVADVTFGSLGQGLSAAVGLALSDRLTRRDARTYAFLSDGEMQEGQIWEAAMFAAHQGLARLTALIDCNNSQVDGPVDQIVTIEPLAAKWDAFGWDVSEVDGHDVPAIHAALSAAGSAPRPGVVLARTSIVHGATTLPPDVDGHFVKLPPDVAVAVIAELEGG